MPEAIGQKLRGYVVHERGEAHIPAPASSFTYAVQPHRRAGPTLRPGRGRMASVALGCPPSLPIFRWPQFGPAAVVRIVRRYYAGIRRLASIAVGLMAQGLPQPARRLLAVGH